MRKKTSSLAGTLALALCVAACGGARPAGPTVMIVEDASSAERATLDQAVRDAETRLPVVLETRETPPRPPEEDVATTDFAETRRAYDDGDLERALAMLPDAAAIDAALAAGDRMAASRTLFWRMACLRALGRTDEALAVAHEHASRRLPIPPDVGATNATAETMLRDAHREVAATTTARLAVRSAPIAASVAVDGEPTHLVTPATLDLPPGAHLVTVSAPLRAPRSIGVTVEDEAALEVTLDPLEPEPAARALHALLDAGASLDADASLALMATALRARSLVVVARDADRLRAALIGTAEEDGAGRIVRAERVGEHTRDVEGLLRDVLVRGRLAAPAPQFYELPEVWISVAVAVAAAIGITLGLTLEPDVHTRVVLP